MLGSRHGTAGRDSSVTDTFSRPATLDDLKMLLRSLNEHGADYLLIGGYALAAHGYQRATTDIDIVVRGSSEAGQRVKAALMVLPDQAARDLQPEWFAEGENIRVADAFVVDLMLNANGQTYETLRRYAESVVSVWPRHLELTWPVTEHRVHGEHGGCGFGEGNGVCRALAQRRRAERLRSRSIGERFGAAPVVELSWQAATGGAATPRSGCSTAWACA